MSDQNHHTDSDKTLSALYQQSKAQPDSTQQLDQRILAAAKSASSGRKSTMVPFSSWKRWSPPIAAAACMLLGISLTFNLLLYRDNLDVSSSRMTEPAADLIVPQPHQAKLKRTPIRTQADSVLPEIAESIPSTDSLPTEPAFSDTAIAEVPLRRERLTTIDDFAAASDELAEEIVVTAAKRVGTPLTDEQQQLIDEIIELLEDGDLVIAKERLNELWTNHPELINIDNINMDK